MFCNPITEGEAGVVSGFGDGVCAHRRAGLDADDLISSGSAALSWRVRIPVPEPTSTTRSEAGASAIMTGEIWSLSADNIWVPAYTDFRKFLDTSVTSASDPGSKSATY
jgi:hypothetical protein